jgi:hypothetical protein
MAHFAYAYFITDDPDRVRTSRRGTRSTGIR